MAKKENSNKKSKYKKEQLSLEETSEYNLHPEIKKSVLGVVFGMFAIVTLLAYFGYAGVAGGYLKSAFTTLLGVGSFIVPITFFLISAAFFKSLKTNVYWTTIVGGVVFLLSFLGLMDILGESVSKGAEHTAGWIGYFIAYPFVRFFGFWVSLVVFISAILVSFSLALNIPLKIPTRVKEEDMEEEEEGIEDMEECVAGQVDDSEEMARSGFISRAISNSQDSAKKIADKITETTARKESEKRQTSSSKQVADFVVETHRKFYTLPPLDLLDGDKSKPSAGDVKAYSDVIKRTLKHFGIDVEMGEVNVGPTVTQYTLKPAHGVKLAKIIALQNDLSLALAAHPIRIEAPIPGRSLVGIEIPNKVIAIVRVRELLASPAFAESSPLTIALGRDVSGMPQYADIERMPHLLVAGATGAGKSVSIHTILTSLLYKNYPQMIRFLMIDPKRVELSVYNGIPHLLAPVIVEREKAIAALNWAVKEMERRYEFLAQYNVRNIASYNSQIAGKRDGESIMPYIVIIIDELADLMSVSAREVEAAVVRIAQMARAVGIHLIISTQRPSVEVITGLIKANIPCRIAFQVASLVDSRTILDMSGAEKLLGNGDMLFLPQDASKPRRIQGVFISEKEVKKVIDHLKEQVSIDANAVDSADLKNALERKKHTIDMDIDLDSYMPSNGDDELLEEAKTIVINSQKASTSFLQRKLRVGYARAARLMDLLEEHGVVGPADGAKAREVYAIREEHNEDEN